MKTKLALLMLVFTNTYFFAEPASAEFTYKENYDGLYSKETVGFGANGQYNNREIRYKVGKNTKIYDINQIRSELGIPEVTVSTNPAISSGDIPSGRTGNATHGMIAHFYPPGVNSWAEQAFYMASGALNGRPGLTDFWLQYDIFFPKGYKDRDVPGHWGSKSMAFWPYEYSGPGLMFTLGRIGKTDGSGDSVQSGTYRYNDADGIHIHESMNSPGGTYVDVSVDDGYWQRRTLHLKLPTSLDSNDGQVELWVKHFSNGSIRKIVDYKNTNWYADDGYNYIANGYLLGWSNPGFSDTKQTILFIDNMILTESTSNIDKTAIDGNLKLSSQNAPPNPPAQIK